MGKAALVLLALASCAVDDRKLHVAGACVTPGTGGLVSDFAVAYSSTCPAGVCAPDLVGRPAVSLGGPDIQGLLFPYRSPGVDLIGLALASTPPDGDAAAEQALRAALRSGTPPADASIHYAGFESQFNACIDTSAYSGISFTTGGDLGNCGFRFAAVFRAADAGTFAAPCPIDECFAASNVAVASGGTTTLSFGDAAGRSGGQTVLTGLQWEVTVPDNPPGGCNADFTIDDIRLVSP